MNDPREHGHGEDSVRIAVRETYGAIATGERADCGCSCGCGTRADPEAELPEGADLGLGSGDPVALGSPRPGEVVLDLGCGAGVDSFLAARRVGPEGRVIGVDMTPEMVARARANARAGAYPNVEFRLAEIEHLPVPDESVDLIVSNCVINLSPDKPAVFRETWRVLRPGGRLAIADMVATAPLPATAREDLSLVAGCIGGAAVVTELREMLEAIGFEAVTIRGPDGEALEARERAPGARARDSVVAATVEARRGRG